MLAVGRIIAPGPCARRGAWGVPRERRGARAPSYTRFIHTWGQWALGADFRVWLGAACFLWRRRAVCCVFGWLAPTRDTPSHTACHTRVALTFGSNFAARDRCVCMLSECVHTIMRHMHMWSSCHVMALGKRRARALCTLEPRMPSSGRRGQPSSSSQGSSCSWRPPSSTAVFSLRSFYVTFSKAPGP